MVPPSCISRGNRERPLPLLELRPPFPLYADASPFFSWTLPNWLAHVSISIPPARPETWPRPFFPSLPKWRHGGCSTLDVVKGGWIVPHHAFCILKSALFLSPCVSQEDGGIRRRTFLCGTHSITEPWLVACGSCVKVVLAALDCTIYLFE